VSQSHRYERVLDDLREYRDARDWRQFHRPKDLAIAVSTEAGELLEHFLWREGDELEAHIADHREDLALEIADVAIFLLFLSDELGIDLIQAIDRKRRINLERHPVAGTRGRSRAPRET
jgi:NTP pyrophosphatase (non-canonical NTP hydrolase)